MHEPLQTDFKPLSLTYVLAESIREKLARHSHPAALGILDPRCNCLAQYNIQCLLCNRLRWYLDYPSGHSRVTNLRCPTCCHVCYTQHFRLDDDWLCRFGRRLIFQFTLQGGPLQTKLVTMMIFLPVWMQPHNHFGSVTRRLRQSLQCPICSIRRSSTCFDPEIPSR